MAVCVPAEGGLPATAYPGQIEARWCPVLVQHDNGRASVENDLVRLEATLRSDRIGLVLSALRPDGSAVPVLERAGQTTGPSPLRVELPEECLIEAIALDKDIAPYGATFEDGYRNAVICEAAEESARIGRKVPIRYEL